MSRFWTDEKLREAKRLQKAGASAADISRHFRGAVSRSAVIGKFYREGIARPAPSAPKGVKQKRRPARPSKRKRPMSRDVSASTGLPLRPPRQRTARPDPLGRPEGTVSLLDLQHHGECRWPYGDPRDADFTFCARKADKGDSYCPEHMAFRDPPPLPTQPGDD